jgi:hypothetical protein
MYVSDEANGAIRRIQLSPPGSNGIVTTIIGVSCTSDASRCSGSGVYGCCWPGLAAGACSSENGECYKPGSGLSASFFLAQSMVISYASPCSSTYGCLWVTSQLGTLSVVDLEVSDTTMTMVACIDPTGSSCNSCTSTSGCPSKDDYSYAQLAGLTLDGADNILIAVRDKGYAVWLCPAPANLVSLTSCSKDVGQGEGFAYDLTSQGSTARAGSWADEHDGSPEIAGLIGPWGLAYDSASAALFIADQNVIRYANFDTGSNDFANVITVAGGATAAVPGYGWSAPAPNNTLLPNSGPPSNAVGTNAFFNLPNNIVAVHATRLLYIADTSNNCIRSMMYFV